MTEDPGHCVHWWEYGVCHCCGRRANPTRSLGDRQVELLQLIADGQTLKQAVHGMGVTVKTGHNHLNTAYRRLGVQTMTHAVLEAVRHGLVGLGGCDLAPDGDGHHRHDERLDGRQLQVGERHAEGDGQADDGPEEGDDEGGFPAEDHVGSAPWFLRKDPD